MHTEATIKRCSKCGKDKPTSEFRADRRGKLPRLYSRCKFCTDEASKIASREERRSGTNRAKFICMDARRWDRKHKLVYDLDLVFVRKLIELGCSYCGDSKCHMTLDRIDNSTGHTRDNVVPACERCNLMRRNMPIAAWLHIAPAVRSARELGLFGEWTGSIHRQMRILKLVSAKT